MSDFEARVAAMLVRAVAGAEFLRVERLTGGASQETYRISYRDGAGGASGEQRLALRRAPGGVAAASSGSVLAGPGPATEAALMRAARAAGVPEPEVLHILDADDELGAGFLSEWIEGEALGARIARAPEFSELRPRLARQCGEILARIHSVDVEATRLAAGLVRATPEQCVRGTYEQYLGFEVAQPMIDYTARWLLDHLPPDEALALVHGDFRNGNFMVDESGIVAVLDWELAHIGDPMRDLGWLCTNSWRFGNTEQPVGGFGHYEDLFDGYRAVSGREIDRERVRFWEVFGSFWWSIGCLQMAQAYRAGPDPSVERAAIGRRSSECQIDCVNLLIPGDVALVESQAEARGLDMPRGDELATSIAHFLKTDVFDGTQGRTRFLARVAANAAGILQREIESGPEVRRREADALAKLFGSEGELRELRWRLVEALRDGSMSLDHPGLAELLRESVVNQVAIDQPRYSGFRVAVER